jgi:hypothetical protein
MFLDLLSMSQSQHDMGTPTGSTSACMHADSTMPMSLTGECVDSGTITDSTGVCTRADSGATTSASSTTTGSASTHAQADSSTPTGSTNAHAQADSILAPLVQEQEPEPSNISNPPPYTTNHTDQPTIVNNFYFGTGDGLYGPAMQSCFGPALTAGLMSLRIPRPYWLQIWKCSEYQYQEHEWPNIFLACGVPRERLHYVVGLIHAEYGIELM